MTAREKKGGKTVEEILTDPQVQAHLAASAVKIAEGEAKARRETVALRTDLAAVGVYIDLIWDLVNTRTSYPASIPVLLEHLRRPYDDRTREGIARALTDKAAKPFVDELIYLFRVEDDARSHHVKWAIGNALTVAAGPGKLNEIISLIMDAAHGKARTALVPILRRSKRPEAKAALAKLKSDPDPDVRMWAEK